MTINKFFSLALIGCVAATYTYVIRQHSRRQEAQQHKDDLRTWEGEGGNAAPSVARPARVA